MILAIDVGNTNITVGLFAIKDRGYSPLFSWRFNTLSSSTADEMAAPIIANMVFHKISVDDIKGGIVSSVVPSLNFPISGMFKKFNIDNYSFVTSETKTGLLYDYPNPQEIGADRIVNGAGVIKLHKVPAIIIDFGTATTFCCINAENKYIGGEIMPGVGISLAGLTQRAAKLSAVQIRKPKNAIGKTTMESVSNGIYWQTVGAIEKIVSLLKTEMLGEPQVIATGGYAGMFKKATDLIDTVDEELTLKGLKVIYEINFPL